MGYLLLSVALFSGAAKGYCGKKTSGYTENFKDALAANIFRMLMCIVIGLVIILFTEDISQLVPSAEVIAISALSGISTAVFVVSWLISVKKSAYMMLDIFLMLGILIPLIAGKILFDEDIRIIQWLGIAVLFIAVIIMCSYNNTVKGKMTPISFVLLLICGISNGITDFSQKLFVMRQPNIPASVFNLYTYIFAGLTLIIAYLLLNRNNVNSPHTPLGKIIPYIIVMAVCLFANSYFKTLAAEHLNAVLLYPLNQGAALIISTLMSSLLFKEKLTVKAVVGIAVAFAGLLIINLL